METYLEISKKTDKILRQLYESAKATLDMKYSFNDVMKSNETRLSFLNAIFTNIERGNLSGECRELFDDNLDFLYSFMNGEFNQELTVPKKFFDDEDCKIVPTQEDIKYMLSLIKANVDMYKANYYKRSFYILLPDNSFNMNMARIFDIKMENVAHLLGLTESEPIPDEKKNLLKKYFLRKVPNHQEDKTKESVKLLDWITSEEGQKEILRLNQLTLKFVAEDKDKNPDAYENGNIKNMGKFKERFREKYKEEGLDFPIIRFSRYITKCINSLNFLNMANITQVILDYNSLLDPNKDPNDPDAKLNKSERDMYFVSLSSENFTKFTEEYNAKAREFFKELVVHMNPEDYKGKKDIREFFDALEKYEKSEKDVKKYLESKGLSPKEMDDFWNLWKTYTFVGKHGIQSQRSIQVGEKGIEIKNPPAVLAERKMFSYLASIFPRNIHLIGFGTDIEKDKNGRPITTELSKMTINNSHCDTSLVVNISELYNEYYVRGRGFFLDKIYDSDGRCIRLSNPIEENEYNGQMGISSSLESKIEEFNNNYREYKNSLHK